MVDKQARFKNHSFIAYTKESGQVVALDACAGPAAGTDSVPDYLAKAIYNDSGLTTNWYKDYFGDELATNADYQRRNSITALLKDNGAGIDTVTDGGDSVWAKTAGGITTYADLKKATGDSAMWTSLASYTPPAPTSQIKRIDISQFLDNWADKVRAQLGPSKANAIYLRQDPDVGQIGDSSTISYRCGLNVVMPGKSLATLSLTLKILDTADNALADLAIWLQSSVV